MIDDINEARQKMVANRKELDDMERMSVRNLKLAKSNLFMDKVIWAMQVSLLISTIIIAYVLMFDFFVNQSFFVVVGFWYLSIVWIPAGAGYVGWTFLAARAKQGRAKLLNIQAQVGETHKKVMELRKNAETLIQKLEVLK